ncbi:MAG: hypothetical protein ABW096_11560 [Candidatus Thiodiazotropha sp.]
MNRYRRESPTVPDGYAVGLCAARQAFAVVVARTLNAGSAAERGLHGIVWDGSRDGRDRAEDG